MAKQRHFMSKAPDRTLEHASAGAVRVGAAKMADTNWKRGRAAGLEAAADHNKTHSMPARETRGDGREKTGGHGDPNTKQSLTS